MEGEDRIRLFAVIDEGALRRTVGGPEVMRAQLAYLREMARHQRVEVLVLPATAGAHASPDGAFNAFQMRSPYPYVGCITTASGNLVVEGEKAESLVQTYHRLRETALGEKATLAFLSDLESDWSE